MQSNTLRHRQRNSLIELAACIVALFISINASRSSSMLPVIVSAGCVNQSLK
jgi:predicted transcriptional regulator